MRYTGSTRIEGSNPSRSARLLSRYAGHGHPVRPHGPAITRRRGAPHREVPDSRPRRERAHGPDHACRADHPDQAGVTGSVAAAPLTARRPRRPGPGRRPAEPRPRLSSPPCPGRRAAATTSHLRSGPPPGPAPVRLFLMGANRSIDEREWPPASTRETVLFLHGEGRANSRYGDGTLSAEPPGEEPADHWVHDPSSPVPFVTAPSSAQIGGPDDCAGIQGRSDVLVYSGAPLAGTWSPRSGGCSPRTRSGTARAGPRASSSGRGRPRIPEPGPQGLAASGVPAAPAGGRAASQAQTPIRAAAMASPSTHTPVHPHPAYTPPAAAEPAAPPTKYEVM